MRIYYFHDNRPEQKTGEKQYSSSTPYIEEFKIKVYKDNQITDPDYLSFLEKDDKEKKSKFYRSPFVDLYDSDEESEFDEEELKVIYPPSFNFNENEYQRDYILLKNMENMINQFILKQGGDPNEEFTEENSNIYDYQNEYHDIYNIYVDEVFDIEDLEKLMGLKYNFQKIMRERLEKHNEEMNEMEEYRNIEIPKLPKTKYHMSLHGVRIITKKYDYDPEKLYVIYNYHSGEILKVYDNEDKAKNCYMKFKNLEIELETEKLHNRVLYEGSNSGNRIYIAEFELNGDYYSLKKK